MTCQNGAQTGNPGQNRSGVTCQDATEGGSFHQSLAQTRSGVTCQDETKTGTPVRMEQKQATCRNQISVKMPAKEATSIIVLHRPDLRDLPGWNCTWQTCNADQSPMSTCTHPPCAQTPAGPPPTAVHPHHQSTAAAAQPTDSKQPGEICYHVGGMACVERNARAHTTWAMPSWKPPENDD